tara:strand:- start:119 stop:733 length:615 start_codon:yes stop_codon:yes gene_type:complete
MKLRPVTKLNGETAWCGPSVISSITGFPVAHIVRVIKDQRIKRGVGYNERCIDVRNEDGVGGSYETINVERPVKGTGPSEINECLRHYGYRLEPTVNRPTYHNGNTPTIARWLKTRKDRNEMNLVSAGHHWQLIKGNKFVDSFTQVPVFIRKAPHRRARVNKVWKVMPYGKKKIYRKPKEKIVKPLEEGRDYHLEKLFNKFMKL